VATEGIVESRHTHDALSKTETHQPVNDLSQKDKGILGLLQDVSKYTKMLKAGVPAAAVKAKMTIEGVDSSLLEIENQEPMLHAREGKPESKLSVVSTATPALGNSGVNIEKYLKMLKAGVPAAAVKAKMTIEGVDSSLLEIENPSTALNSNKVSAASTFERKLSRELAGPKLVGFHWEPLEEDKLRSSFFGNIVAKESSLPSDEVNALLTLFERKESKSVKASSKRSAGIETMTPRTKRKRGPTLIDMSRSTNISICLSSFKSRNLGPESLSAAIKSFDLSVLSLEDLLRIKEILPSEAETRALANHTKQNPDGYELLHDSEKCLYQLSVVENVREKIQSMIFSLSYEVISKEIMKLALVAHVNSIHFILFLATFYSAWK
jgi:hypothetical protein